VAHRAQAGSRRQWLLLAGLLIALVAIVLARRADDPVAANGGTRTSNAQGRRAGQPADRPVADQLDVNLEALTAERQRPAQIERNPFRMEARAARPSPGAGRLAPPPRPSNPTPPAPAGPPPIPLKFTGIIESGRAGRIAALTDCKNVYQGRVGDIIEGRYRIVRIGVESIVLEYVDSGVQQTIRLSGCG
jgi:hypothetical protein